MNGSLLAAGFVLAAVVVASRALSRRSGVPYQVLLAVAGAGVSFIPHVPAIHLQPQVVFLGFLPPLVYHAGLITSPWELRANALPIALGALGLVLATTFAVAGAAFAASPKLGWAAAFILGAVVAPTDPVASTSVINRLGAPPKITTILEGESLVNDGIALALFSLGISALARPSGFAGGFLEFCRVAGGGVGFGVACGWLAGRIRRPILDTASQMVVSLIIPFAVYLPANALGLSGVLATLSAGLMLGQRPLAALKPSGRIRVNEFWTVLVFLLESILFVLIGVQLRYIVAGIAGYPPGEIALVTCVTVLMVFAVRLAWWLAVPTLRWRPEGRILDTGGVPWQQRLVLGWSGLRGAISLAAALSVPTLVAGKPFKDRDLIVFATFCTIAATLVGQGTSLSWLLRRLSLAGGEVEQRQHALADRRCAEAALRHLDRLVADEEVNDSVAEALRMLYERRIDRTSQQLEDTDDESAGGGLSLATAQRRLLATQRETLRKLHRDGQISFAVMRDVGRDLDLEHASLEA